MVLQSFYLLPHLFVGIMLCVLSHTSFKKICAHVFEVLLVVYEYLFYLLYLFGFNVLYFCVHHKYCFSHISFENISVRIAEDVKVLNYD